MPDEPFPVRIVTPEMILQDEQLGTKDKYWCRFPDRPEHEKWLLKVPRQEPEKMEHLAEKIAEQIAILMEVPCAAVELAEFEGFRGTVSRNMVPRRRALVHGNEIIAGQVIGYDPDHRRRTSDHTWERIDVAIRTVCGRRAEEELYQMAGYLVLDALIGNTDRHHENWGVLRRERLTRADHELAPSFDHASSLGRELRDDRRTRLLQRGNLETQYLRRAEGGVYLAEFGDRKVPPLVLVEALTVLSSRLFVPWVQKVVCVTDDAVRIILGRIPIGWMTPVQAEFVATLVRVSRNVLSRIPTVCP